MPTAEQLLGLAAVHQLISSLKQATPDLPLTSLHNCIASLAPGETITLARKHSFKPITTRTYHPGEHALALQINGTPPTPTPFHLLRSN